MVLVGPSKPLQIMDLPVPKPDVGQVLIHVEACGVCRTDLHIYDGELPHPKLPLIMGHQVVGKVVADTGRFKAGDRVGVPWLAKSCGHCPYCVAHSENLCDNGLYMGYQLNGGYAEYCVACEDYIFSIPENYSPLHAAPLLCAGLIGYRSLRLCGTATRYGFYGFGASAHILAQVVRYLGGEVYAFTRDGDTETQNFAKSLGAVWAGGSSDAPPKELDAAIIFAPAGELVPVALKAVKKGGSVVSAGIHMSEIPAFSYDLLYGERILRSVTNLTREDGQEFFALAQKVKLDTTINVYPLEQANQALHDLKFGKLVGSFVLRCSN